LFYFNTSSLLLPEAVSGPQQLHLLDDDAGEEGAQLTVAARRVLQDAPHPQVDLGHVAVQLPQRLARLRAPYGRPQRLEVADLGQLAASPVGCVAGQAVVASALNVQRGQVLAHAVCRQLASVR